MCAGLFSRTDDRPLDRIRLAPRNRPWNSNARLKRPFQPP
ncbi:hypothetical protein P355_1266 [Burkholderia cenocepacia KC-01]|nr:hypothetical protein P355_1266 [Burkholderia cenocepacia KC-01]